MSDPKHSELPSRGWPSNDSPDTVIVFAEGNEDTTVRPLDAKRIAQLQDVLDQIANPTTPRRRPASELEGKDG